MTSASTYSDKTQATAPEPGPDKTPQPPENASVDWSSLPVKQPPLSGTCWLHREQPGAGQPFVILSQKALEQIDAHSVSDTQRELGGALLGQAYQHENRIFVEVRAALIATSPDHGPIHFTFDADTWTRLQQDRANDYPDLDIVGWFHTHPGLGVFYSSDDVVVHSAAFTLPWHIGLVVDPLLKEVGVFGWVNGQLAPFSGCYELLDQYADPMMPWDMVRTAVWYDDAHEGAAEQPGGVYMPSYQKPALLGVDGRIGLLVGAFGVMLSLVLFLGWIVPLANQANRLESLVLTMADQSLATSNVITCPDSRIRILSPVTESEYRVGSNVAFLGTASHPETRQYRLELRPQGSEGEWALLNQRRWGTDLGQLGRWNTTDYQPGVYEIRLTAVDRNTIPLGNADRCLISLTLLP